VKWYLSLHESILQLSLIGFVRSLQLLKIQLASIALSGTAIRTHAAVITATVPDLDLVEQAWNAVKEDIDETVIAQTETPSPTTGVRSIHRLTPELVMSLYISYKGSQL
jgi:hypothetical protein